MLLQIGVQNLLLPCQIYYSILCFLLLYKTFPMLFVLYPQVHKTITINATFFID